MINVFSFLVAIYISISFSCSGEGFPREVQGTQPTTAEEGAPNTCISPDEEFTPNLSERAKKNRLSGMLLRAGGSERLFEI